MKLGYTDCKVLGTILGYVDGITLGIDVGTYMGSIFGSFDSYDDGKLEVLLLVYALGYTDGKVLVTILGDVDGISL